MRRYGNFLERYGIICLYIREFICMCMKGFVREKVLVHFEKR